MIVSGQQKKKKTKTKGVCRFTSIIKTQTAKARSLESCVCPCYSVNINFDSFSLPKLHQHGILCLHVLMKRFTIFLRILSCQSSYIYFKWKLVNTIFLPWSYGSICLLIQVAQNWKSSYKIVTGVNIKAAQVCRNLMTIQVITHICINLQVT